MPPVRVAIVNDYEIVIAGVVGLLAPFEDRIRLVELAANKPVASDVSIVLYDTFGQVQGDGYDLSVLLQNRDEARVVVFSWNVQPDLIERAIAHGARGYLSKALNGEEIVDALEAIHRGEVVILPRPVDEVSLAGNWPGKQFGLTQRESEVLALITQGLTNQEIADRAYISINSVKTYVRTAYRKIDVTRRAQAVSWGIQHGFQPDYSRAVAGA